MESALMVYGQSWRDPEKAYRERRWSIRKRLPTMPAIELQNCINSLNEDLETLKAEIEECIEAVNQLKHGIKPETMLRKFGICQSISDSNESVIAKVKGEIEWRKRVARWVLRERAIYLWERRLRKAKAVKIPFLKQRRKTLSQEGVKLLAQAKEYAEKLQSLYEDYLKTSTEYHNVTRQIKHLDFSGSSEAEGEPFINFPAPYNLIRKLNNSLMKGLPKFPKSGERYAHTHDQSDM